MTLCKCVYGVQGFIVQFKGGEGGKSKIGQSKGGGAVK